MRTKYLGAVADESLTSDIQTDNISTNVQKNICVMKHMRSCAPEELLVMLYKTIFEPFLGYTTMPGANADKTYSISYRHCRIELLAGLLMW